MQAVFESDGGGLIVARGLLDFIAAIPLIMKEQACTWEQAEGFWRISMEMEAERAEPETNIIPFPMDRVR
jgi:hypothetical protein